MKAKMVLCLLIGVLAASMTTSSFANVKVKFTSYSTRNALAGVTASSDTVFITGDDPNGATSPNAGMLENTINADTTAAGARVNPNRVYALYQGRIYWQNKAISVNDPTGTLTIVAVASTFGTQKPIIVMAPVNATPILINGGGADLCYGSIKLVGLHWQTQQLDKTQQNELFYCGTANKAPQSLTIDNCLFEFSNIDLFDCTNENGAIGGWPYGAKFFITNSYFRNLFFAGQWWGSRIYQCKHPIDTAWIENNTITTGGLTFLQQNEITDVAYVNHNTIINNKKYWMLSPYHRNYFLVNNIFINQDWVGEDTNVTNSGQDPDKLYESTVNVDTNNYTNGLVVEGNYYVGDSSHYSPVLGLGVLNIYVSNNVNYYDPKLTTDYYNNTKFLDDTSKGFASGLPSELNWAGAGNGPWKIGNVPGEWENSRTQALFAAYGKGKGGFIEENTTTADPQLATPAIASDAVVDAMGQWNQNQWSDPRFTTPSPALINTAYIYGDYDPTTIPGKKTEDGDGITKFTDLTENFAQSTVLSTIDGFPVGSLIWDDTKNAAYAASHHSELSTVISHYLAAGGLNSVTTQPLVATTFNLSQNYPNPFNPTTDIQFTLPQQSTVELKVYNMLGQEVATLIHGTLSAGMHTVNFDAHSLASGVYIYRLSAGNFTSVKKMMLLK
ncbi:MAG TPA: T9SS type A sorting domain-containing protein [Bacteroidota bacterium]|nr:T9SS type A sorting domain-containing protein [Bacteroidota bacterium]